MSDHDKQCEAILMPRDYNGAQLCRCKERALAAENAALQTLIHQTEERNPSLVLNGRLRETARVNAERELAAITGHLPGQNSPNDAASTPTLRGSHDHD